MATPANLDNWQLLDRLSCHHVNISNQSRQNTTNASKQQSGSMQLSWQHYKKWNWEKFPKICFLCFVPLLQGSSLEWFNIKIACSSLGQWQNVFWEKMTVNSHEPLSCSGGKKPLYDIPWPRGSLMCQKVIQELVTHLDWAWHYRNV